MASTRLVDKLAKGHAGLAPEFSQWIVSVDCANGERWALFPRFAIGCPPCSTGSPQVSSQANRFANTHILSINRAVFWLYSSLEIRKSLSKNREMNATVLQSALQPLRQPASQAVRFANAPNRTVNRCEIKDLDFHFRSYSSSLEAFSKANLSVVLFFSFSFNFC